MNCQKCDLPIQAGVRVCPRCGAKINTIKTAGVGYRKAYQSVLTLMIASAGFHLLSVIFWFLDTLGISEEGFTLEKLSANAFINDLQEEIYITIGVVVIGIVGVAYPIVMICLKRYDDAGILSVPILTSVLESVFLGVALWQFHSFTDGSVGLSAILVVHLLISVLNVAFSFAARNVAVRIQTIAG